jgi:large-conductance mechanosensitive channel
MIQDIIVYVIVSTAIFYTIYAVIKNLRQKSSKGCGDSCACSAKTDIKKVLISRKQIR